VACFFCNLPIEVSLRFVYSKIRLFGSLFERMLKMRFFKDANKPLALKTIKLFKCYSLFRFVSRKEHSLVLGRKQGMKSNEE